MKTSISIKQFAAIGILMVVATGVSFGFRAEPSSVALLTKTIQEVSKRTTPDEWKRASKGEALLSGDQVRTGQKSIAIVKFIDNSLVRVRELSELTIQGESGAPGRLSKTVQLGGGAFGFDIRKQKQNEQFRLTSPTSVASIRGTQGKMSGGLGHDTLVVTEGLINFKNTASNNEVDVPAGYIAFSNEDGSISSRPATALELADANSAATGGLLNNLNLELRDNQGNKKQLKLQYKK